MKRLTDLGLSSRISGLIIVALLFTAWLMVWRSESVIEEAILEQTKHKAQIFLRGLEREIQLTGSPRDPSTVQPILARALNHRDGYLGFSIRQLYAYDGEGRVIAYAGGEAVPTREMDGHYGQVIRSGKPYLGEELESYTDPVSGRPVHKVDVIVPLREGQNTVAGLEVEINVDETMAMIGQLDNRYETEMLWIVAGTLGAALLFIGFVIHHGLLGPLRSLGRLTHRIAEGELSTRAENLSGDELGRLGESINRMADSIEQLFNEQESAYLQAMQSLAKALEAKDAYTAKHSARVAKFSVMLGRRLGLDERELRLLKQGALMHDLGKIGIADAILNKPASLDDAEYEVMRSHPVFTATIMRPLKRFKEFTEIAAWHHERWDGNGYPDGLQGEAIPLLARIVAIADTWDAMTGDRIYRKGMTVETALGILERERHEGQWDPHLLGIFIEMVRAGEQAHHTVEADIEMVGGDAPDPAG